MGLPSKKQLHKHKRGTRKALDTLDALEKNDITKPLETDVDDLIEIKKAKKATAKKGSKKKKKQSEPVVEKPIKKETVKEAVDEPSVAGDIKEEPVVETQSKKPDIKLDFDELEPQVHSEEPVLSQDQELPVEPSLSMEKTEEPPPIPEKTKGKLEIESIIDPERKLLDKDEEAQDINNINNYDEEFEDTQKDKYLTFQIASENFGVSIKYVTEIIVIQRITEVPDTPAFVKGVINLRGQVIPVISVRHRFGLEEREYDERTCIIVIECLETAVGMIVDTVNEVIDIPENQVDPPPKMHSGIKSSYIQGMGKIKKEVVILLDVEKVLFVEELLKRRQVLEE